MNDPLVQLQTHIKIVHEGIKEFQCHQCEKAYGQEINLKKLNDFVEIEFLLHLNISCIKHIRAPGAISVLLHCFF